MTEVPQSMGRSLLSRLKTRRDINGEETSNWSSLRGILATDADSDEEDDELNRTFDTHERGRSNNRYNYDTRDYLRNCSPSRQERHPLDVYLAAFDEDNDRPAICAFCGIWNHTADECWKKHNKCRACGSGSHQLDTYPNKRGRGRSSSRGRTKQFSGSRPASKARAEGR